MLQIRAINSSMGVVRLAALLYGVYKEKAFSQEV